MHGMHGMHHGMGMGMGMHPMMGMHHGMHGMHGMGMMNPMMNPMMMGGHMGHMGMMGMHPGMMGMPQQQQQPLVQVNDMSKHGHAQSDSAERRRLQESDDESDEDELSVSAMKCLQLHGVVCVRGDVQGGTVSVEYTPSDNVSVGSVSTEEWRVEDMKVGSAQIYECHDHFDFVESLCVEKWKLDDGDVAIVAKHKTAGDLEFALDAEEAWTHIYHFAEDERRLCRELLGRTLCVEVVDDAQSGRVSKIERIYIEHFEADEQAKW